MGILKISITVMLISQIYFLKTVGKAIGRKNEFKGDGPRY